MGLVSMTGYGRGEAAARGYRAEVEVSAVNRKQFDLCLNLPRGLTVLEPRVSERIHAAVSRGQVSVTARLTGGGTGEAAVRADAAARLVRDLRRLGRELKLAGDLSVGDLSRVPGLVSADPVEPPADLAWRLLRPALEAALEAFTAMRGREGAALGRDLSRRLALLRRLADRVSRRAPALVPRYRRQLLKRLADAGFAFDPRDPAVIKDLALYAERIDISEELTRLDSHLQQAAQLLQQSKPVGRPLDFLCQELFREINTAGAKASDVQVARHVIAFKAELEAFREQVQNVE